MSMSPRLRESPKRRALGDITNIVDKKNPKVTDGKQNMTVNIATVKKDTEVAVVGVADVAEAAVMEVDEVEDAVMEVDEVTEDASAEVFEVAEDAVVREVGTSHPDSNLSIFSVPEKLVPPPRREASPEWDYCEEMYISMRQCEETCSVQAKDLPAWFDKQYRVELIEYLTEVQIWINVDFPIEDTNILNEILFKTVSTIER